MQWQFTFFFFFLCSCVFKIQYRKTNNILYVTMCRRGNFIYDVWWWFTTATKLDQVKLHRAHRNQSCVLPPTCSPRGHDIQSFSTIQGRLCGFCTAPTMHLKPAVLKTLSPSVLTIVRLRSQMTVVPNITGLLPGSSGEASLENDLARSSTLQFLHGQSEAPRLAAWLQAPTAAAHGIRWRS